MYGGQTETYSYGQYGEFNVIMKENGYINATKLCQDAQNKTGSKKEFRHWKNNSYAKRIIAAIASDVNFLPSELFIEVNTGNKNLTIVRGTYVHPDLIPHIASWASPDFAIMVARIVNQYIVRQAIKAKDRQLEQKDDKIDKLVKKIDKLIIVDKVNTKKIDSQQKQIAELLALGKSIHSQNVVIKEQNVVTHKKLNRSCHERVPHSLNELNEHKFVIVKK